MSLPWPDLTTEEWYTAIAKMKLAKLEKRDLRALDHLVINLEGNERSGNWGHAGRPGEVGGSAPGRGRVEVHGSPQATEDVRERLSHVPAEVLAESRVREIHTAGTSAEVASKIDDYLLRHYGFDVHAQAMALVDKERRAVIAKPKQVLTQVGRLYEERIRSKAWHEAVAEYIAEHPIASPNPHEDSFAAVFAAVFTGHAARQVMSITNPFGALLEHGPVKRLLHKWGWKI